MTTTRKTLDLDPELAYDIVIAALNVIGNVSASVHARVKRQVETGILTSNPTVNPEDLYALRQVLNKIGAGGSADEVIRNIEERRKAHKA